MDILISDDRAVVRDAIASTLTVEPDFVVAGQASNGPDAVRLVGELRPNVVLMDVSLPGMSGLEATRLIAARYPEVRVIGLSLYDGEQVQAMLAAGATSYVDKAADPETLLAAVRACQSAAV